MANLIRGSRRFPLVLVAFAGVAAGCASESPTPAPASASVHVGVRTAGAQTATARPKRPEDRMSAMGRRALQAARHGALGNGTWTTQQESCDNEPDCEDEGDEHEAHVDNVDGPNGGGQAEFSLAVDATGQHVVVGFNDTRGFARNPISVSGFAYSDDGGKTFTDGGQLPSPGLDSIGADKYPRVYGDAEIKYLGECTFIYASILMTKIGDKASAQTMGIHRSTDCGHTWEGPFEVTAATNPNGILNNGAPADAADKEFMDVDRETGRVILSWTNFTPSGVGGVQISTTYSDDILAPVPTWSHAAVVGAAEEDGQSSIPRFAANGSSMAYVAWRKFPATTTNNVGFARSTDNGATWSAPIKIAPNDFFTTDQILGNDRINTSPSLAVARGGMWATTVYVVYEANDGKDGGDIFIQRSFDQGLTFTAPVALNSRIAGDRSQWIPWVTVDDSTGRVYVFYYDQGPATSGDLTQVTYTFSDDGGDTWKQPRPLTARPFHAAWGNDTGQPNLGDYNQAVAQNGELFAVWAGTKPVDFFNGEPASGSFMVPEMSFGRVGPSPEKPNVTAVALGDVKVQESGNDGNVDPGDVVQLTLPLRNYVTNPLNAAMIHQLAATVSTSTPGVTVVVPSSLYRKLAPGDTGDNLFPYVLTIDPSFVPGTPIELSLQVTSDQGEPMTVLHTLRTGTPHSDLYYAEDFESYGGQMPSTWSNVHAGGANTVPWVAQKGFCGNNTTAMFHANAEDGPAGGSPIRFERLWSPEFGVPSDSDYVMLDFDVCYDTEDDPAFGVQAYDGFLLRIADLNNNHVVRSVLLDAFEEEFTTGPFLGYPKHLPRNSNTAYFQDMSAWAGDSGGSKHVHLRLPGLKGWIQLRFEFTQDSGGTCADLRPGHTCGVSIDNIEVRSVKNVLPPTPGVLGDR